jgi:hypothetical protein
MFNLHDQLIVFWLINLFTDCLVSDYTFTTFTFIWSIYFKCSIWPTAHIILTCCRYSKVKNVSRLQLRQDSSLTRHVNWPSSTSAETNCKVKSMTLKPQQRDESGSLTSWFIKTKSASVTSQKIFDVTLSVLSLPTYCTPIAWSYGKVIVLINRKKRETQ